MKSCTRDFEEYSRESDLGSGTSECKVFRVLRFDLWIALNYASKIYLRITRNRHEVTFCAKPYRQRASVCAQTP